MKTKVVFIILSFISLFSFRSEAQTNSCTAGLDNGVNILTNSTFASGNTGFTYTTGGSGYTYFTCTPLPSSSCYSSPGMIYVGAHSDWFNQGFNVGSSGFGNTVTDHTSTSDNMFLMVDGTCTSGNDAWSETVTVLPNTYYYFEAYVTNINNNAANVGNANLNLNINGTAVTSFSPPLTQGTWDYESYTWFSGTNTTAVLAIQNTTSTGCSNGVDFGLDDITFTPGCKYSDNSTPQPTLASAGTLCGTAGSVTLSSGVTANTYKWINSAGTTLATTQNYNTSTPGTYTVCVQNTGGCLQAATTVVQSTYTVSLPSSITLCNPPSTTLTPTFGGPNGAVYSTFPLSSATYVWQGSNDNSTWTNFKGSLDSQTTYLVNSNNPEYYRVIVTDNKCGTQTTNSIKVTTQQSAIPNNQYFCPTSTVNLSVNGTAGHTYDWYTAVTGGTKVATNTTSYTTPAISTATTYYVQDTTVYTETSSVGASALPTAASTQQTTLNQYFTAFTANQSFVIDSVTVYWWMNNNNPNDAINIQVQLYNYPPGGGTSPTLKLSGTNYSATNSTAKVTPTFPTSGQTVYAVRVPVNITVPSAGTYSLSASSSTTSNVIVQSSNTSYPYNDAANVLSITGTAQDNNSVGTTYYGDFYNWRIHYYLNCGRVPVTATPDCAQPVKFSDFTVKEVSNSVYLNWQTATERNSSYFEVERSTEGLNFISIGKVVAAGNSDQLTSYSFVDNGSLQGYVYYRIVEYDIDGGKTISSLRSVDINSNNDFMVMPNPNSGTFMVTGKADDNTQITISIANALGILVYETLCQGEAGVFSQAINISNLPSGIYYLTANNSANTWVKKIVKE